MAKKGLGRGLDALLNLDEEKEALVESGEFITLNISYVEPNRKQPRKAFDEEELESLAESIKEHGIIQPITVKNEGNGFYSIIAGERRWRAAKMAGLKEVPVRVMEFSPLKELEISLVENLQRENLNPIEEAMGYKRLIEEYTLTQEDVSAKVGKSRSAVANALRLLSLSDGIIKLLEGGELSAGHAKALLLVKNNQKRELLAKKAVDMGLSVRETEKMAGQLNEEKPVSKKSKKRKTPEVLDIERRLSEKWDTKILLEEKKKGGKIEIEYYNINQREAILEYLGKYKK